MRIILFPRADDHQLLCNTSFEQRGISISFRMDAERANNTKGASGAPLSRPATFNNNNSNNNNSNTASTTPSTDGRVDTSFDKHSAQPHSRAGSPPAKLEDSDASNLPEEDSTSLGGINGDPFGACPLLWQLEYLIASGILESLDATSSNSPSTSAGPEKPDAQP